MKIKKLEENYLDDLHKYNKKRQKGMSPFCYLNPNAGNVPKAIDTFNNSVDNNASIGMSEDYEEEIIRDDPEAVENIKKDLKSFGGRLRYHISKLDTENALDNFKLNMIDFEVDYIEDTNDYYLVMNFEVLQPFTGQDFRSNFIPIITKVINSAYKSYKSNFEFHIEINCYDVNSESYATCILFVDNIGRIKNLSFTTLTEASYGGAYDIKDDQYFTREEINEFAFGVCAGLSERFGYQYEPYDVGMETPNKLYISIEDNNGIFVGYTLNIDMRRIRSPHDLYNRYYKTAVNIFAKLFSKEHQAANLDEAVSNKESTQYKSFNDRLKNLPKEKLDKIIKDQKTRISCDWEEDAASQEYEKLYKDDIDKFNIDRYGFTW